MANLLGIFDPLLGINDHDSLLSWNARSSHHISSFFLRRFWLDVNALRRIEIQAHDLLGVVPNRKSYSTRGVRQGNSRDPQQCSEFLFQRASDKLTEANISVKIRKDTVTLSTVLRFKNSHTVFSLRLASGFIADLPTGARKNGPPSSGGRTANADADIQHEWWDFVSYGRSAQNSGAPRPLRFHYTSVKHGDCSCKSLLDNYYPPMRRLPLLSASFITLEAAERKSFWAIELSLR